MSHRKKRFCLSVSSLPRNLDFQCFFTVMFTSEKLMLDFFYLPFLQASLVTVIHLVSSVVDSVEKEGILLLLRCWLSVCFSVWWVIISCPKCHFLHPYQIYRDREINQKTNHIWKISLKCLISQSGASFEDCSANLRRKNCNLAKADFTFPPFCDMKQFFCVSKWHEDCLIPSWFFHLYPCPLTLFFFFFFHIVLRSSCIWHFLFLSFLCNSLCFLSKESFSAHEHKNPRGDLFIFIYFFCTICLKPFKVNF